MVQVKCIICLILCAINIITFIGCLDLNKLDFNKKQKYVLQLLNHITEPTIYSEIKNISKNFNIENHAELYSKMEDVRIFIAMKRKGIFSRGNVFCLFCDKQTEAAIAVFKILHGSKDFSTFLITSCWLRQEINEMLFIYTFSIALHHRTDCNGLIIPPIYETYPFFYVPGKMQHNIFVSIITSTTTKQMQIFEESQLKTDRRVTIRYFTEDFGLNSFYYNFHLDYPFWMTDEVYGLNNNRRGELYIYLHRQLLARYNLERLSHNVCEISPLNPTKIIDRILDDSVLFHNGWTIPDRNVHFNLYKEKYELVKDLEYLEYQIRDAAYSGFYNTVSRYVSWYAFYVDSYDSFFLQFDGLKLETQHKGVLEALGRRVYGNSRKANEITNNDIVHITRALFSSPLGNLKSTQNPTSRMQYYETALRDPIFWKLQKYLIILIKKIVEKKSPYRRENLYYYGIDILKMTVSPLVTYFGSRKIDITNMLVTPNAEKSQRITLYQKTTLEHIPFNITLKIYSDKREESVIRIFLRQTTDCEDNYIDAVNNLDCFIEIDAFNYKLNIGNNTVVRKSSEMNNVTPLQNITSVVRQELETNNLNVTEYRNSFTGLPANLILPRGSKYGLWLQMFVIVSSLQQKYLWENNVQHFKRKRLCRYTLCIDERPLGFPFDRKWESTITFYPNMKLIDVFVFHKNVMPL